MDEQSQAEATTAKADPKSTPTYNLPGTLSQAVVLKDKNGNPYVKGRFTFTTKDDSRKQTRTAMGFGRAHDKVIESWKDGEIRLYGKFESQVFLIVGMGLPPKEAPASQDGQQKAA